MAWIGLAVRQEHVVLRLIARRADHMQTELERHLFVGPRPVEQRDCRPKSLEVQVASTLTR